MKAFSQAAFRITLGVVLVSSTSLAQSSPVRIGSNVATGQTRAIQDHDLVRGEDGIKVYIVKGNYRRHILNPKVFALYGHLKWENVLEVRDEILRSYAISNLYRAAGDEKVYIAGETPPTTSPMLGHAEEVGGEPVKRWVEDPATFRILQFSPEQVFEINEVERDFYNERTIINKLTAETLLASSMALVVDTANALDPAAKLTEKIQELAIELLSPVLKEGEEVGGSLPQGPATTTEAGTAASSTVPTATTTASTATTSEPSSGGGGHVTAPSDTTPPAAVSDLAILYPSAYTVFLTWTTTGDDGTSGTSTSFDIRYSNTAAISESNWSSASQASEEPTPGESGLSQNMGIGGLTSDTTYYFAMKAIDENNNRSALSNVPSMATKDITAPSNITNLSSANATHNSVDLSWTAPGDSGSAGTATSYEIRRHTSLITDSNWGTATYVSGAPAPQAAGSSETFSATGLPDNTLLYFAIKTRDESFNWSGLSNIASATTPCEPYPSGSQTYSVSTANQPRVSTVTLNPLDVAVSASQIVTVAASDSNSNSISSVTYSISTDTASATGTLSLVSGTDISGTWEGSYTATNTHCDKYSVTVTATSASGTSTATVSIR